MIMSERSNACSAVKVLSTRTMMTLQSSRVFSRNRVPDVTSVTHSQMDRTNVKVLMYIGTQCVRLLL